MKQQRIPCSKLQELEPVQKYNVCVCVSDVNNWPGRERRSGFTVTSH
jgi:hypothetical protein